MFNLPYLPYQWRTDFSRRVVVPEEIRFLGLMRDAIPPIYEPHLESTAEADGRMFPLGPVIVMEIGSDARAYPQTILVSHEVVNDVVGGVPVAVTW
ncbi:MAG: DUF3179 domain-containing protein [Chloroflexi bacterium]|nr:DUF3179 domain-containing protein [Chloroflexota bacterium]